LSVTYNRKKGLTEEKKEYFRKLLRQVEKESNQKIVDYDKLYHKILLEL
jgi:REP element-mobilizing transposase RayT